MVQIRKLISVYWPIAVAMVFSLVYLLYLLQPIDLTSSDLGRHIMNGRLLWQNPSLLTTNFYSYTYTDYSFVNHHWLTGVLFNAVHWLGWFSLLIWLKAITMLATLWLVLFLTKRRFGWLPTILALSLNFWMITERLEVRPEIFSYLFFFIFLWGLQDFDNEKKWPLFILPLTQLLWVNLHVYFFLGPLLFLIFAAQRLWLARNLPDRQLIYKKYLLLGASLAVATLLNPFFLQGALYPLQIFQNYGYELAENKSPFFMHTLTVNQNIINFFLLLPLFIVSFFANLKRQTVVTIFLSLLAVGLGIMALRNLTFAALLLIYVIGFNIHHLRYKIIKTIDQRIVLLIVCLFLPVIIFFTYKSTANLDAVKPTLQNNNSAAAEFVRDNNLTGTVFNNYDIGGYLIFYHYPSLKTFVDNRPEAYPAKFFQNEYIPMQLENSKWRAAVDKYGFDIIYWRHQEGTPWGRNFFRQR
ncbi:MAG: hypothetical protein NUV82_01240, partial [Candidatus Komeilibacteria bacterium]|nr:hypothetical protein [Candidatus Komeilibacteria bacterium]